MSYRCHRFLCFLWIVLVRNGGVQASPYLWWGLQRRPLTEGDMDVITQLRIDWQDLNEPLAEAMPYRGL